MKSALFTNFSDKEFTGWWDGKPKKFAPGESLYMPDFLAQHYAKHLANREILKIPKGETMTSPKFPEQVPEFQKLFNKAYTPDTNQEDVVKLKSKADRLDEEIDALNKNKAAQETPETVETTNAPSTEPFKAESMEQKPQVQDPTKPQIFNFPDDEDDDDEPKGSFPNKPQE